MRILLPNKNYQDTVHQQDWIENRYSHRYYCKNQKCNIDTDGPIKKCPQCNSEKLKLLEERKPFSIGGKIKLKIGNRITRSYVKPRWPAKTLMDKLIDLKRDLVG